MGNRLTKHQSEAPDKTKKESKKSTFQKFLARLQIRPNKPESSTKQLPAESKTLPPPKPPLRNQSERLQSKSLDELDKSSEWTDVPLQVPPSPTSVKQEYEIKTTPVPPPRKHKLKLQEILHRDTPKKTIYFETKAETVNNDRIPVEEPIIVPKKVIEHVCDGTHKHVKNIVNGKVVDQIIPVNNNDLKQNKPSEKNTSTLSLPSYIDQKKKDEKRATSPTKSSKKKSSASSLPTDKKPNAMHTAAEKIESYMIRCKSFGSIIPNHVKTEKQKPAVHNSDNESVDSWSGLEDWDLGIIEHDVSTDLPRVPAKKRISNLSKGSSQDEQQKREEILNHIKPSTEEFEELLSAMDKSFDKTKRIPASTPTLPNTPPPIPTQPNASVPIASELIQRTPHKTQSVSPSYPFKPNPSKSVFESDAFFSSDFIHHERIASVKHAQTKMAPLAAFDSDRESEKDSVIDDTDKEKVDFAEMKSVTVSRMTKENNSTPAVIPRRKSSSGHSKLLKYIKDDKSNKSKNEKYIKSETEKSVTEAVEEPQIVPTIKTTGGPWNDLVKRNDIIGMRLLEQESTISDLVETSSDGSRSTTVDTSYK